jgi:hypothetical protein
MTTIMREAVASSNVSEHVDKIAHAAARTLDLALHTHALRTRVIASKFVANVRDNKDARS